MGMMAMGCNFALVGATQDEFEFVHNVIDENRKMFDDGEGFDPSNGPGSVIMLDSFDTPADYDIGIDLSENEGVQIRSTYSHRVGYVSYIEKYRRDLLYQLVMMHIGFKFVDVEFNDIMSMFEKRCDFQYIDCQKNDYFSSLKAFIDKSTMRSGANQTGLFIQMIDPPDVLKITETDELIEELGFQDYRIQVITFKDDTSNFQSGVFITK